MAEFITRANRLARRFNVSPLLLDAVFEAAEGADYTGLELALERLADGAQASAQSVEHAPSVATEPPDDATTTHLGLMDVPEGADAVLSSLGDITGEGPAAVFAVTKEAARKLAVLMSGGFIVQPRKYGVALHRIKPSRRPADV